MKKRNWTRTQQASFLKSLGVLLEKGYTVSESLKLVKLQYQRHTKYPIKEIQLELQKGTPLVEVLSYHQIPADILGYLYFATEYGSLSHGLIEGSEILNKRERLKKVFYQKVRYPLVLIILLGTMMFFMIQFLFPQFTSLFHSVDLTLPVVTRIIITLFQVLPVLFYLSLVLFILLLFIAYWKYWKRSAHEKVGVLLKIPVIKLIVKTFMTHYFSSQFGHLLKGGLSITQALHLFERQNHMQFFQVEAGLVISELRAGETLSDVLQDRTFYLPELSEVVVFGQSNGRLGEELILFSDMLLERTDEQVQRYLTMIQPLMFGFIGSIVLILFLSVMLPVFKLFQSL